MDELSSRRVARPPSQQGILTLSGYGLRIAVERGHLVVEDGVGTQRRRDRFSRVDRQLKRVLVLGHSGTISLDAIDWLQGVGVPLIHLGHDGQLYFVSAPSARTVAPLRRAQALALDTPRQLLIARDLIVAKISGQLSVLDQVPHSAPAQEQLATLRDAATQATSVHKVKDAEARASRAYWRAWKRISVGFVAKDRNRRPLHWQSFGTRISPISDPSPRKAVNPANAVLNYLYAMLEAETTIALLGARLDPALGFLHADNPNRASLACDLMEPIRPAADAFALSVFRDREFTKEDVFERRDGQCRLLPPLTRQLALTAPLWAQRVTPLADQLARALVTKPKKGPMIVPGVPMPRKSDHRKPRGRTAITRAFDPVTVTTWAELQRSATGVRGSTRYARAISSNREWNRTNAPRDPEEFRRSILPRIQNIPLRVLMEATGMSNGMCSEIRRGLRVPHPRHWEALVKSV